MRIIVLLGICATLVGCSAAEKRSEQQQSAPNAATSKEARSRRTRSKCVSSLQRRPCLRR